MESTIIVCVHCNEPLTYEKVENGFGNDGKRVYSLNLCICGSHEFMTLDVPAELVRGDDAELGEPWEQS